MTKEHHSDYSFRLQKLPTGHVAPFDDDQVLANTSTHNNLGQIVHGTEMAKIPKGSLVIDCGAFIGDQTIEFVSYGWKVIAFEPFWDNYVALTINSPKSVNIMAAVGNGSPQRQVHECPGTNHGMRQTFNDVNGVPSFRLDDLPFTEPVALIKIDVEGSEFFVLEGASDLLKRDMPMLWIEAFPEKLHNHGVSIDDLARKILSFGYGMIPFGSPPRWDWLCMKSIPASSDIWPR